MVNRGSGLGCDLAHLRGRNWERCSGVRAIPGPTIGPPGYPSFCVVETGTVGSCYPTLTAKCAVGMGQPVKGRRCELQLGLPGPQMRGTWGTPFCAGLRMGQSGFVLSHPRASDGAFLTYHFADSSTCAALFEHLGQHLELLSGEWSVLWPRLPRSRRE